jgi:GMP synthase (glutamine-hydrolysing)
MPSSNRPRVLVIQHTLAEGLGLFGRILRDRQIDIRVLGPGSRIVAGALQGVDGLVVLGGPMSVYDAERQPRLRAELDLVRDALSARTPILGLCLGSQLLASALGSAVYPGPRMELGWYDVTLEPQAQRDRLFHGAPRTFKALHWHGDVFDLPPQTRHLAHSALTEHQAFSYQDFAWGLLFHLEAGLDEVHAMATAFDDEVAEDGQTPQALLEATSLHAESAGVVALRVFRNWLELFDVPAASTRTTDSREKPHSQLEQKGNDP